MTTLFEARDIKVHLKVGERIVRAVDGVDIGVAPDLVHYVLNKPAGVVTTASDPEGRPTVVGLVPAEPRVFPVGRLDIATEGLLLLTNDGGLARRLELPANGWTRRYRARVHGLVDEARRKNLSRAGAFIRQTARRSMRKRKLGIYSEPGNAPYSHGLQQLKNRLFFAYDPILESVVIGPEELGLLSQGVSGLSIAFDLPTQMGFDSDDVMSAGEVGRVGVALDSYEDVRTLMEDIPLERISQVRTTANAIGWAWVGWFAALAKERGVEPDAFGLFIQNDVLKEFVARGTQKVRPGLAVVTQPLRPNT